MRTRLVVGVVLVGVAFIAVLHVPGLSDLAVSLISNLSQLASAVFASVGCAVAARRTRGRRSRAWLWLSAANAAWAIGQVVFTYYEDVLSREVPIPSVADAAFLLFPVCAGVGLVIWLGTQRDQLFARGRDLMDGAIIAGSLLVLSWITTMGTVAASGIHDGPTALVVSLAYPVGDLVLATLVLIALAHGTKSERFTLTLLVVGLGALALSDSTYVYLTSIGAFSSAGLLNGGWVVGFLFAGVSGLTVRRPDAAAAEWLVDTPAKPSMLRLGLPYVPFAGAGLALVITLLSVPETPTVDILLGVALVLMVLLRQFLAMTDHVRLAVALADARDQLAHQAMHDPLTGLPNRLMFADRLDQALMQSGTNVSVLFCDLDDFKLVNDGLGHHAGDTLLQLVARRLLTCVRDGDTVARLGGDEFAILLSDSSDAVHVADRIVGSLQDNILVDGHEVHTSISVGIAHHEGDSPVLVEADDRSSPPARRRNHLAHTGRATSAPDRDAKAAELLRLADTAMYAAKGAGKSRAVLADVPTEEQALTA